MPNVSIVVTLHDYCGQTATLQRDVELPFHPQRGLGLRFYGTSGTPWTSRVSRVLWRTDTSQCIVELEDKVSTALALEKMSAEMGVEWQSRPDSLLAFRPLSAIG